MTADRRYTEEEIEAIFRVASEAQEAARTSRPHGRGLTVAELQEIGLEAGITPEFIAHAAAAISRSGPEQDQTRPRSYLGLPTRVRHVVELPAPLGDEDWDELVALARDTFEARGRTERDGTSLQWHNGNLHVMLERTAGGQRLRMGSRRDMGRNAMNGALMALAFTLFTMSMLAGQGQLPEMRSLVLITALGLISAGLGAWTAITTPQWARERERQMQQIADRALELSRKRQSTDTDAQTESGMASENTVTRQAGLDASGRDTPSEAEGQSGLTNPHDPAIDVEGPLSADEESTRPGRRDRTRT